MNNSVGFPYFQWIQKHKLFVFNEGGSWFVLDLNFSQWYLRLALPWPWFYFSILVGWKRFKIIAMRSS